MKQASDFRTPEEYHDYLRTFIATNALCSILSNPATASYNLVVADSVKAADGLLKALNK